MTRPSDTSVRDLMSDVRYGSGVKIRQGCKVGMTKAGAVDRAQCTVHIFSFIPSPFSYVVGCGSP